MISLLGNNECIRHDILMSLYIKKYIVAEHFIDEQNFLTKPYLTVHINPVASEIQKGKKEDTICFGAKNNLTVKTPSWMKIIPYDNTTAKCIMKIYDECCPYGRGRVIFGIIGMKGRAFTMGGAYVHMIPKQLSAIKILLYNSQKQFSLYDISSYLDFHKDKETGFMKMVEDINNQCKRVGREKLIFCKNNKYFISHEVINY